MAEGGGGGGRKGSFPLSVQEDWRLGLNIDGLWHCGDWRRLAACLGFFHEDLRSVVEVAGEVGARRERTRFEGGGVSGKERGMWRRIIARALGEPGQGYRPRGVGVGGGGASKRAGEFSSAAASNTGGPSRTEWGLSCGVWVWERIGGHRS